MAALFTVLVASACYDTGDGSLPPADAFYYPVGLKVSHGGSVLYAVNSDFDLQFNGGTIQSYDLRSIRRDTVKIIANPLDDSMKPFLAQPETPGCPTNPPVDRTNGSGTRQPLGETCAPPVQSNHYIRDSALIGAFATDMLMSPLPSEMVAQVTKVHAQDPLPTPAVTSVDRLFIPVRGSATLTWAQVTRDATDAAPSPTDTKTSYAPFRIQCGQDNVNRCDHAHAVGEDVLEPGNTRHILLPGEPFGAAISEDGTSIVMTHQNDPKTSLFLTGMGRQVPDSDLQTTISQPSLQFVVINAPSGGIGLASVPHDPDAFLGLSSLPRPAYYETSSLIAQVTLLRQYADENGGVGASIKRPFITVESAFSVAASAGAIDSRGIKVDITPRLACKAKITATNPAEYDRQAAACAKKPARAFIANRTPPALLVGDVGGDTPSAAGGASAYDPDRLQIHTSVPLTNGPSQVYLAPIVDKDGAYALRVFVVCFDAAEIFVYDPDAGVLENIIKVGVGPYAMAFDPFDMNDVATHKQVPFGPDADVGLRRYRFGYVSSFTQSYVQVLDLDNAIPGTPLTPRPTYEQVVFTLGNPTNPKGS